MKPTLRSDDKMDAIKLDTITHVQEGYEITYAYRKGQQDWFVDKLQLGAHNNPAWYLMHRRRLTESRMMRYADFGANIGTTTFLPAKIGHKVLAVEAGPENALLLSQGVRRNEIHNNMTVAHWAAAETLGLITFYEHSAWGSTKLDDDIAEFLSPSTVPAATIAEILDMYGMTDVDVIKIDIEGGELAALTDFEKIAKINASVDLVIESNWGSSYSFGYQPQAIWQRMADMGFSTYLLEGRLLTPVTPDMPQVRLVSDILATRRTPAELEGKLAFTLKDMDFEALPTRLREAFHPDQKPEINEGFFADQLAKMKN
jgi:FkbM family methyltransferase